MVTVNTAMLQYRNTTHVVIVTVGSCDGNSGCTAHVVMVTGVTAHSESLFIVPFSTGSMNGRRKGRERGTVYRFIWYNYLPVFWQRRS